MYIGLRSNPQVAKTNGFLTKVLALPSRATFDLHFKSCDDAKTQVQVSYSFFDEFCN